MSMKNRLLLETLRRALIMATKALDTYLKDETPDEAPASVADKAKAA